MRRQFKIKNHQIEQLKEEIQTKDHNLVKEHFNHHKVWKWNQSLILCTVSHTFMP